MIEARNLNKYYGRVPGIEDVSFKVNKGEIAGFLGPNGAGKTTTMRILAGYMPASSGTATVAGYDILHQSLQARKHIGYLPETVPLYTDMTVRSYLNFSATIRGLEKKKKNIRVREVMQICRIEGYADLLIYKLSKGYRQRVGVAQAILHDPDVLILDEPTVGIDPRQVVETRQLIKELGQNHTIILSSHVLPEISIICGKVIIMDQGRIVTVDKTENLSARLRGAQRIDIEVRGPNEEILSRLKQVEGVFKVTEAGSGDRRHYALECARGENMRHEIASVIVHSGWHLLELKSTQMSLEDIFLKLTTEEQT